MSNRYDPNKSAYIYTNKTGSIKRKPYTRAINQTVRSVARHNDINVHHLFHELRDANVTVKSLVKGAAYARQPGQSLKKTTKQVTRGVTRNVAGLNKQRKPKQGHR